MAIIRTGGGVATISGSIGGVVYSRNRGGPYCRNRAIPVNPASEYQEAVRAYMSQLVNLWQDTLTSAQRAAWDNYAEQVPLPNSFGDPRNVGGIGMYVRSNLPRLQNSLPRVDAGPIIFNLGGYTQPSLDSATAAAQTCSISFDNTDDWASEDDAAMLIYLSRAQSPSVNYFRGPYRVVSSIDGDSVTPPTSPEVSNLPFPVAATQILHARFNVTRADGRLGSDFRDFVACGA